MYVSLTNAIGYIDLSKRRVSPEDIAKCDERYTKSKIIASIMRHVATRTAAPSTKNPIEDEEIGEETVATVGSEDTRLQALYEQIAWPLAEKYGHTYEAFKVALT